MIRVTTTAEVPTPAEPSHASPSLAAAAAAVAMAERAAVMAETANELLEGNSVSTCWQQTRAAAVEPAAAQTTAATNAPRNWS